MSEFYPVYNRETPENFKKIFAEYAAAIVALKGEGAKYNPETFVIEQESNHLLDHLTVLSERDLQNPHIKFFVERNPGWKEVGKDKWLATYLGDCGMYRYITLGDQKIGVI